MSNWLTGSVNGAKPFALQAELKKDFLFVAGQPRVRRVVERDASGLSARVGHRYELSVE